MCHRLCLDTHFVGKIVIRYSKCHPTYVQRAIVDGVSFGYEWEAGLYDSECTPVTERNNCCAVFKVGRPCCHSIQFCHWLTYRFRACDIHAQQWSIPHICSGMNLRNLLVGRIPFSMATLCGYVQSFPRPRSKFFSPVSCSLVGLLATRRISNVGNWQMTTDSKISR